MRHNPHLVHTPYGYVAYGRASKARSTDTGAFGTTMNRVGWLMLGASALSYRQSRDAVRSKHDRNGSEVEALMLGIPGLLFVLV